MSKAWIITISDVESTRVMFIALDKQSAKVAFEKAKRLVIKQALEHIRHIKKDQEEEPDQEMVQYLAGQIEQQKKDIAAIRVGTFPGKYLGLPNYSHDLAYARQFPLIGAYPYALNGKRLA